DLEVVVVDLRTELDLLDLDVALVLAGLRLPVGVLVEELPGVQEPADGRGGAGRDLHQVEPPFLGQHERLRGRHDAELGAVLVDDADFLRPDAVVDADRLGLYETPPDEADPSCRARSALSCAILRPSPAPSAAPT